MNALPQTRTLSADSFTASVILAAGGIIPLTPRRKGPIIIHGTSIEAPGFDSPEGIGAPTVPFRVRFFYDRRMGDIRKDVPVSDTRVVQPLCVCRHALEQACGRQGSSIGDLS